MPVLLGLPRGGVRREFPHLSAVATSASGIISMTDVATVTVPRPGWYLVFANMNLQRNGGATHHYWQITDGSNNIRNVGNATHIQIGGTSNTWWTAGGSHYLIYVSEADLRIKLRVQSDTTSTTNGVGNRLTAIPVTPTSPWMSGSSSTYPHSAQQTPGATPIQDTWLAADVTLDSSNKELLRITVPRPGWYLFLATMNSTRSANTHHQFSTLTTSAGVNRLGPDMTSTYQNSNISGTTNSWWTNITYHQVLFIDTDPVVVMTGSAVTAVAKAYLTRLTAIPVLPDVPRGPVMAGSPRGDAFRGLPVSTKAAASNVATTSGQTMVEVEARRPGRYLALGTVNYTRTGGSNHHINCDLRDSTNTQRANGAQHIQIAPTTNGWLSCRTYSWVIDVGNDLIVRLFGFNDSSQGETAMANTTRLTLIPVGALV